MALNKGQRRDRASASKEPPCKRVHDTLREFRKIAEQSQDVARLGWFDLSESYKKADANIALRVAFPRFEGVGKGRGVEFYVFLKRLPAGRVPKPSVCSSWPSRQSVLNAQMPNLGDLPVFIDYVETVKRPKQRIPSLVWFQGAEFTEHPSAKAKPYVSTRSGTFKLLASVMDWESDSSGFKNLGALPVLPERELICDVIQRRSEIMNHVASGTNRILKKRARDGVHLGPNGFGLRVLIEPLAIRAGLKELPEQPMRVLDMFFGPFNL
jgi:hypothetical protein